MQTSARLSGNQRYRDLTPHCAPRHDLDDETVFVLAGTGTFWAGDLKWELSSGDTAYLPRGVPHAYAFTSGEVELLTVCTPAGMEDFFRAVG
jgi:quercetin dioxygenase-like cupin family protein